MTHRDGFPRLSVRSAWRGDAGHRKPRAPSQSYGPSAPWPKALGKPSLWVIISTPWYVMETRMMDWLRQMIGLPEGLHGLIEAVNDSGALYLTGTRVGDRTALRFAVGRNTTTEAHVARAWERIAAIARAP